MSNEHAIEYPKTLVQAVRYFSDPKVALEFFVKFRWPDGVRCPHCGSDKVHFLANQNRWKCSGKHPKRQFTVKVGSVMEDSPLGLDKWAVCIWLEVNSKNSISSWEIHRALGITQKSAWFMLHRVRHALHVGKWDTKLTGVIEADESFVGGAAKNMHADRRAMLVGRGPVDKTAVAALLQRHDGTKHSTVRAHVVENTQRETLHALIHKNVEKGSTVYSDALPAYRQLGPDFIYDFVDHSEAYVKDRVVHTNGLQNFWSLLKRCIKGTHVSVDPFHLLAYVDSEAFRFNHRKTTDGNRFRMATPDVFGKRLTYKELVAWGLSPVMGKRGKIADGGGLAN